MNDTTRQPGRLLDQRPCRLCGAAIVFVETAAGKSMPCNPDVTQVLDAAGVIRSGRTSHFLTCPRAHEQPRSDRRTVPR